MTRSPPKPAGGALAYERAKALASDRDPAVRAGLATDGATQPELLYYLADDDDPAVRRAVAANDRTPVQAAPRLARDQDGEVRTLLARRLARALPTLSGPESAQLRETAYHAIELLAADQMARVRAALASALSEVEGAPPQLVGRLAREIAREVAEPVLRGCAQLSDDDLIDILAGRGEPWAVQAVARRRHLSAPVSDAVLARDDEEATGLLLDNPGAEITVQALGALIDRARDLPTLQPRLAARAGLPPALLLRLAELAEESVLRALERRGDLDEETRRAVGAVLRRRLEFAQHSYAETGRSPAEASPTEEALWDALSWGDRKFVRRALALLARIPEELVDRILASDSPRSVTALAWRAGLSMRCARQLQIRGAGIHPKRALNARHGTDYPLSEAEMAGQLEFFGL
jgi:uncharacterized protein (DUF2336 family)